MSEHSEQVYLRSMPIGSTVAQDEQRCPLVRLPETLLLAPEPSSWSGQSGVWKGTSNGVQLAFWGQTFLSSAWQTLYIRNQDGRLALRAEVRSESELRHLYGWMPGPTVMSYQNISTLEEQTKAIGYHGFKIVKTQPNEVEVRSILAASSPKPDIWMAFTDCESQLLFVARLEDSQGLGRPASISILDRDGDLVAHGIIDDPTVARYQFVDPNGYLIATAASPGIHQTIPMKDVPRDPTKGNILPYALHFESGGYANASRLLDVDYRWVLATAVQARAVFEAHTGEAPSLSGAVAAFYWCIGIVAILACICAFGLVFRVVYPLPSKSLQQSLWPIAKPGQRGARSYSSFPKVP